MTLRLRRKSDGFVFGYSEELAKSPDLEVFDESDEEAHARTNRRPQGIRIETLPPLIEPAPRPPQRRRRTG